jgi:anthranilate synthase component 1
MYVQAGGGVVYDSDEEYEFNETLNKAQALFSAAKEVFTKQEMK